MITIYKPGAVPVKGLRTSLQGAQLGDGFFQKIDNLRWDTGVLKVRNGIAEVSDDAPSSTCLGAWSGALNGVYYVLSAWAVAGKTQVWSLNLATGVMTELTLAGSTTTRLSWGGTGSTSNGTSSGETRLPSANPVTFCVHSSPRRLEGTADSAPKDFLTISNGVDWPLLYNPAGWSDLGYADLNLAFHKKVRIPPGGSKFSFLGTWVAKFPVAGPNSGKTFTNKKADNTTSQSTWALGYTSATPYDNNNDYCVLLTAATPLTGDWCKVDFVTPTSFPGEQMTWVLEGGSQAITNITDLLDYSRVQVSENDSTYYTIYDPSASDPALAIRPIQTPLDTGNQRFMLTFSLNNIPLANRSLRYIKITRISGKGVSYSLTILAIAGCGGGAGMYGGTEWSLSYAHRFSESESGGITGLDKGYDLIKNIGGPSVVTSGSGSVAGAKIVGSPNLLFDFRFDIQNAEFGTVYGGLEGPNNQAHSWPSHADLYFRTAAEAEAGSSPLYWQSFSFYDQVTSSGDHQWKMFGDYTVSGSPGSTPKQVISVYSSQLGANGGTAPPDRTLRDPGTPLPSAFNIAMPRAYAVATANQRTFAGAVRDEDGNPVYSDLYFSALGFPFRFASLQESETAASRLTFAGERIRGIVMSAAAANGASTVYVLTDQSFNALGTAGGFVGSGYDASALSTRVRISSHGTNEPGSIAERSGVIFYVDQEGQVIRFTQGGAGSVSRFAVDDKPKGIPAAYRGKLSAAFWRDRYYLAYTPAGGSGNTRILGWNEVLREWEFDDTLPSGIVAASLVRAFDASQDGSGQRLLLFGSSGGKVYGYEEGWAEPGSAVGPSVALRTREFQSPTLDLIRVNKVQAMIDAHTATLYVHRIYKPRDSRYRTEIDCADAESKPKAIKSDTRLPVEETATGKPEDGWSACLDFNGPLGAGKTLWRIEADIEGLSKGAGER